MGYPEHLKAALEQLQEHLLQCWELSLYELRQENESLRLEIAQQYEDKLQLEEQHVTLKAELAALQASRTEQESDKIRQLETEIVDQRARFQETLEIDNEVARRLKDEIAILQTGRAEAESEKTRQLEGELQELRVLCQESREKEGETARQLELVREQLNADGAESSRVAAEQTSRAEEESSKRVQLEGELQVSQEKVAELARQLEMVREQLNAEAAQSSRLTLEIVDLKLEQEKRVARLRGLPEHTPLNLPALVEEERPADPQAELQRLAYQDAATGLPNLNLARRYLGIELGKAEKCTVALAILHLERWDELEKVLAGDEERQQLLNQFAERVRDCVRPEDVLASGGDGEFWVIFPLATGGPLGLKNATEMAQRSLSKLLESLKIPFVVDDHKLLLSIWGGLRVSQGTEDPNLVVRQARLAQESARAKGSNRLGLFQPEMEKPARRRDEIAPMLRQALIREQFSLRFLPVVELKTGQIKGVEALVRWDHPTDGLLEPAQFLDAACASGMIVGLGEWVMSCVCEMSRDFRSLYWFINLSRPELMQADLARRLTRSMEAAQLNRPDYIVVECQEKDIARPDPRVKANLKELKNWKVGLAVDDFAFADLALKGLDKRGIGFLKISHQVTQDLDQLPVRNLVKGGLIAAEAAGARLILKGIENQGQLDLALEIGCPWGQGHRLSGPLTWPELEERLKSRQSVL